jgi:hypothetical protein
MEQQVITIGMSWRGLRLPWHAIHERWNQKQRNRAKKTYEPSETGHKFFSINGLCSMMNMKPFASTLTTPIVECFNASNVRSSGRLDEGGKTVSRETSLELRIGLLENEVQRLRLQFVILTKALAKVIRILKRL